jgi:hypothetical protein
MPESKSPSNLRQSFETRQRDLPVDIAQSLQRSAETAELSLRVLNRLEQTTSSLQWTSQSQQEDHILLEIRRGSWLGHYRYSETFSDRLAGLLDTYLQNWERDGLNERSESQTPQYNSFPYPRSSLHFCAAFGCEGLASVYLQMGQNPNLLARPSGQCPLHLAAAGGHIKIVKMLLDRGADIEARTAATGRTALQIAAFRGRGPVVRVLLENGADITARDDSGQSAADLALASGYDPILGLLLRVDMERTGSSAKAVHRTSQLEQTRVLPLRTRMERLSSSQVQMVRAEKTDSQCSPCLKDSCFPHPTPFPLARRLASREHAQISHSSCMNCDHQADECCSQEESDGWVDVGSDYGGDFP